MIYAVTTGYAKSTSGGAFSTAWTLVLNAIAGAWGTASWTPASGVSATATVRNGAWESLFEVSDGVESISLPSRASGITSAIVTMPDGSVSGSWTSGSTLNINGSGSRLVYLTGQAYRS